MPPRRGGRRPRPCRRGRTGAGARRRSPGGRARRPGRRAVGQLVLGVDHEPGHAVLDQRRQHPAPEPDDRHAGQQGLDDRGAARLLPPQREQHAPGRCRSRSSLSAPPTAPTHRTARRRPAARCRRSSSARRRRPRTGCRASASAAVERLGGRLSPPSGPGQHQPAGRCAGTRRAATSVALEVGEAPERQQVVAGRGSGGRWSTGAASGTTPDRLAAQVGGRPASWLCGHRGEPHPAPAVERLVEAPGASPGPSAGSAASGGHRSPPARPAASRADDLEVVVDDVDASRSSQRRDDGLPCGRGRCPPRRRRRRRGGGTGPREARDTRSSTSAVLSPTVARTTRWPASRRAGDQRGDDVLDAAVVGGRHGQPRPGVHEDGQLRRLPAVPPVGVSLMPVSRTGRGLPREPRLTQMVPGPRSGQRSLERPPGADGRGRRGGDMDAGNAGPTGPPSGSGSWAPVAWGSATPGCCPRCPTWWWPASPTWTPSGPAAGRRRRRRGPSHAGRPGGRRGRGRALRVHAALRAGAGRVPGGRPGPAPVRGEAAGRRPGHRRSGGRAGGGGRDRHGYRVPLAAPRHRGRGPIPAGRPAPRPGRRPLVRQGPAARLVGAPGGLGRPGGRAGHAPGRPGPLPGRRGGVRWRRWGRRVAPSGPTATSTRPPWPSSASATGRSGR